MCTINTRAGENRLFGQGEEAQKTFERNAAPVPPVSSSTQTGTFDDQAMPTRVKLAHALVELITQVGLKRRSR